MSCKNCRNTPVSDNYWRPPIFPGQSGNFIDAEPARTRSCSQGRGRETSRTTRTGRRLLSAEKPVRRRSQKIHGGDQSLAKPVSGSPSCSLSKAWKPKNNLRSCTYWAATSYRATCSAAPSARRNSWRNCGSERPARPRRRWSAKFRQRHANRHAPVSARSTPVPAASDIIPGLS